MGLTDFWQEIVTYAGNISFWELSGLVFGLLCVVFLIKENILTWPFGIAYVIVSFIVFWDARLYGDFILHVFFLVLNIYGWYNWTSNKNSSSEELEVTKLSLSTQLKTLGITILGVLLFAQFLKNIPNIFPGVDSAALPYWDSITSILSVTGMWLTAKKKLDNWYYWIVVNILATGIYFYKDLYFYSALYFVYIGLTFSGYFAWKKSMQVSAHKS